MVEEWVMVDIGRTASVVVVATTTGIQAAGPAAEVKSGPNKFPRDTPERQREDRGYLERSVLVKTDR